MQGISVRKGVRLKNHTTFRIGGKADLLCMAKSSDDIVSIEREYGGKVPITYLGRGSNVLVSDAGVKGLVVLMRNEKFALGESHVEAEAGVPLCALAAACAKAGLSGLEFACCIPGSVGGALVMNAGAHGASVSDILEWVEVLRGGEVVRLSATECEFSYRKSNFLPGDVILRSGFKVTPADKNEIAEKISEYKAFRKERQPQGLCAGSVFKAADGKSAGYYIDAAGLKGLCVGGAFVSQKHANFIINSGSATAQDVTVLIDEIKARVYAVFGVKLQEEIIYVGEFEQ